jgi:transposase
MRFRANPAKYIVNRGVRQSRRATRRKLTAEEKVRIVLEGLRGESTIAGLRRKEGIQPNLYRKWSEEFLEAGKQPLIGGTQRQSDSQEAVEMRSELAQLKPVAAELPLKNRALKEACWAGQRLGTNDAAEAGGEARDHPPGEALRPANQTHPGRVECAEEHLSQVTMTPMLFAAFLHAALFCPESGRARQEAVKWAVTIPAARKSVSCP